MVYGNEFGKTAGMDIDEHGGRVYVFGKGVSKTAEAAITVDKYSNGAVGTWDKNGNRLATLK